MGLLRSLTMLSFLVWLPWLPDLGAQLMNETSIRDARSLDALLQDYAYRAFVRPRTGIPYDGTVPSNLTGIRIRAMRLVNGSLRKRGVRMYREFVIPTGIIVKPYVKRLVLVYQNLGNWTEVYYSLPGYTYLAPVLGLLAYDASNLSAKNLAELEISASGDPMSIVFPEVKPVPDGHAAKCVRFNLEGLVIFSNVESGNTCTTVQQGHFSIVVESVAPSPAPTPATVLAPPGERKKKSSSRAWIIIVSVLGGLFLMALVSFLVWWVHKLKRKKEMQQMERAGESGEALRMTSVGESKAPAATGTRTQPTLEAEYAP